MSQGCAVAFMAAAQSGGLHTSTAFGRAYPCAMSDCVITLLPSESCAHCTKAVEVVFDEPHERKDYAQVELTDMMKDEDGRVVYPRQEIPNPDQFTDDVSYYDIYGSSTDIARRLSKKH